MSSAPTCFFGYAWCENDKYAHLKFIKHQIESRTQGKVDVILDRESYKANEDFDDKEREINTYDLIIVCNSTELRTVHDNPEKYNGRRVLKELEVIKRRLKNNKESVFSFLIEGDESVILPMFKNRNTKRLDDFSFFAKNDPKIQFQVADHQVQEFDEFIDRIAYLTKVHNLNRSSDYLNARESLDKLLNLTNITVLPPTCLVKTDIYEKIIHQEGIVYFVVGRKGAGKSTLVRNFISQVSTNKYKQALPISAESFQHEMAYSLLYLAHEKDSQIISPCLLLNCFGVFS